MTAEAQRCLNSAIVFAMQTMTMASYDYEWIKWVMACD